MIKVEVIGVKKIDTKNKVLYYVSAISEKTEKGTVGLTTYNAFVRDEHLKKYNISPADLVGTKAEYYNVKNGDTWESGITFKNT